MIRFLQRIILGGLIGVVLSIGWSHCAWAQEEEVQKHDPKVQKPMELKSSPRIRGGDFEPSPIPPLEDTVDLWGSSQRERTLPSYPEVRREVIVAPWKFDLEGRRTPGPTGVGIRPPHFPDPAYDPRLIAPAIPDSLDRTPSAPSGGLRITPATSPPTEPAGSDSTNR